MQIFVPYPDLDKSVRTLDPSRLGNQVWRECLTLIRTGWSNHPASRMWIDYKPAMAKYALYGLAELRKRRHINFASLLHHRLIFQTYIDPSKPIELPPWFGDNRVHSSHRAALLSKNFKYYQTRFGWSETPIEDYYWPV